MLWFFFVLTFFQEEPPLAAEDLRVDFTETVTVVNLPLRVWRHNHPYRELKLQDLSLVENGIHIDPQQLHQVETPLTIHFLFDLSTSNERHIWLAKRAVRDVIQRMKKADKGKISFFSSLYQPLTPYTGDQKDLLQKLSSLTPIGSTALYDGISGALDELGTEDGTRVLVLLSDGHDLLSHIGERELMAKVKSFGIPILFLSFSEKPSQPLLMEQRAFMEALVDKSGGAVIGSVADPVRGLHSEIKQQRSRYMISFVPPIPEDLQQWRSLVLRVENCPECLLEYRRAYQIDTIK